MKPERVEGRPEAAQRGRGELPLRPLGRVPPGDGGVVEQRGQADVERRAPQLDRRRRGRLGQRVITGSVTSMPPGACGLAVAIPTTSTVVSSGGTAASPRAGLDHDLREAGAVADDEEGQRRELAATVDPALQPDRRSGCRRGAGLRTACECVDANHASPPVARKPWRCGRGQGRGATTPSPESPLLGPASRRYAGRAGHAGHEGCQASREPGKCVRRRATVRVAGRNRVPPYADARARPLPPDRARRPERRRSVTCSSTRTCITNVTVQAGVLLEPAGRPDRVRRGPREGRRAARHARRASASTSAAASSIEHAGGHAVPRGRPARGGRARAPGRRRDLGVGRGQAEAGAVPTVSYLHLPRAGRDPGRDRRDHRLRDPGRGRDGRRAGVQRHRRGLAPASCSAAGAWSAAACGCWCFASRSRSPW